MVVTRPRLSSSARAAVFAPLDPLGRAEVVARRLADAIALGLLRDGERLPSEQDLGARFGVATVTVREALTALREQGLVSTRRGRGGGSFVLAPADPAAHVLRSRLRDLSLTDLRDLCDHYAAISSAAAELAADRAGPDDVELMQVSTAALAEAPDVGARRRAEGQFHVEMAAAAQSARLTREEIALQTEIAPLLWLPYADQATHARAVRQHERITEAVHRGATDEARHAAQEHVHDAYTRLRDLHLDAVRG